MNKRFSTWRLILRNTVLLLLAASAPAGVAALGILPGALEVSQLAPPFALPKLGGTDIVRSTDAFGSAELTLLIFWDSYCPDCLKAVARCQVFQEKSDSLGVSVLSVNFDWENLAGVRDFVRCERITFPVLSDPQGAVAAQYGAESYDFSFFILDKNGIVRSICYDKPPDLIPLVSAELERLLEQTPPRPQPARASDTLRVTTPELQRDGQ